LPCQALAQHRSLRAPADLSNQSPSTRARTGSRSRPMLRYGILASATTMP
jgi:hypothetical protein